MTQNYSEEEEAAWIAGVGMGLHRESPGICYTYLSGTGHWDTAGWGHRT